MLRCERELDAEYVAAVYAWFHASAQDEDGAS